MRVSKKIFARFIRGVRGLHFSSTRSAVVRSSPVTGSLPCSAM